MSILSTLIKPLAYVSLPVYVLSKVASATPFGRYYIRLSLFLSSLSICSVWGIVCAVGMSIVGERFNVNFVVARSFYNLASRVVDIKVEVVEGEQYLDTRPAVLVANHQSMVDILLLGRVFPKRASIMGKKELQWAPLLGQYMTLSGAVFVDRGHNAKAVQSLTAAGETIKARSTSLWMFPEGTRSMRPHNDMLSFKKGAFHTAVNAGVPIVPVVFENYWRLYHKGVFESGTIKVKGMFSSTPNPTDSGYLIGKFCSKVLPPIPTEGLKSSDVNELTDRVRDIMVEALKEISTSSPSLPTPPKSQTRTPSQLKAEIAQDPLAAIPLPTDLPTPSSAPSSTPSISSTVPTNLSVSVSPSPSAASVSHPDIDSAGTRSRSESRASTSYTGSEVPSSPALSLSRFNGIESGVETEEDEGMVLVGRPPEA